MSEIKRSDVDVVAAKLQKFAKTLPEQEKNVLGWLLSRAQASAESVEMSEEALEAVAGGQAMTTQLAESLGFGPTANEVSVTGTIRWAK